MRPLTRLDMCRRYAASTEHSIEREHRGWKHKGSSLARHTPAPDDRSPAFAHAVPNQPLTCGCGPKGTLFELANPRVSASRTDGLTGREVGDSIAN